MENFILYEELGAGSSSVVYKGRRKGNLNYVAIICTDKAKRAEITNHVRLSHDLDHPNIVSFYEWYETSNHLWLVVELCTGGSLESVIGQDGCLSEDVVRRFGWDLVKGLEHIHDLGIIFSDLTPAKILLDGSGILKFGNFCRSKAQGETLEDFFTLLSISKEAGEGDSKENFDHMRKRLQGSPAYSAPEVLQGSETNMSSDLWALGCIIYYMYTGKPPFCSDSYTELSEMILHQEPPPPRQTVFQASPPSEDFLNLLKGLFNKNPNKRMDWPELLDHPFWTQAQKEDGNLEEGDNEKDNGEEGTEEMNGREGVVSASSRHTKIPNPFPSGRQADKLSYNKLANIQPAHKVLKKVISSQTATDRPDSRTDNQQADTHTSHGAFRNSQGSDKEAVNERRGEGEAKTEDDQKLTGAQQMCHTLHPKSLTLAPVPLQEGAVVSQTLQTTPLLLRLLRILLYDLILKPFVYRHTQTEQKIAVYGIGPNISCGLTSSPVLHFTLGEKLQSMSDEEWRIFLQQLCSSLEQQNTSAPFSSSSIAPPPPPPPSTAIRSRLNLLCYLCCVVGHKDVANRLINSALLPVLTLQLRQAPNWDVRSKAVRVMGLLALYCTELREDSPVSEAVSTLTDLLRDNLRNSKVKQFLLPPLGEFLYLIASQEDSIVHHMAAKAIENISTTVSGPSHPLVTTETGSALWYLFTHSTMEAVRVAAISSLSRLTQVVPAVFLSVIDTCGPAAILEGVGGAGVRVQQHLLTAMATALVNSRIQIHRVTQSRVFRSQIVTEEFLAQIGLLLNYVTSIESNETNLANAVGCRCHPASSDNTGFQQKWYESLLGAEEPIPLYALKLLVSMTEHSTQICRLIKHSRILPTVFQLIMAKSSNITSGMVQNAVALLCNLSGDTVLDLEPLYQQGLTEVVVSILSEAAVIHLDGEAAGRKLSTENQEVWEESIQCLSLLVQLYGGEGHDCLSPSCLHSFSYVLHTHMDTETPRIQRTTLRIIKRLVQTTDRSDWLECSEGAELESLLQDIASSNRGGGRLLAWLTGCPQRHLGRSHVDVVPLAAEILQEISGS
ncbi:hypothetical protein PAMP_002296 [Pampus punctatissimus]